MFVSVKEAAEYLGVTQVVLHRLRGQRNGSVGLVVEDGHILESHLDNLYESGYFPNHPKHTLLLSTQDAERYLGLSASAFYDASRNCRVIRTLLKPRHPRYTVWDLDAYRASPDTQKFPVSAMFDLDWHYWWPKV